jgi:YesN/AraC family two-component response regulator
VDARFRILFVDDEPLILEGLRRTLRRHAEHWTAAFATGGDEALEVLAEADPPFDAIVSDLRMPGMDGLTLLGRVREAYPAMTRVLLSGNGGSGTYDDELLVAHQFLAKPCETERLRTTLARVQTTRAMVDDPRVREVVGQVRHLLSVPRTYWELARLLGQARTSLAELTAIVERDAGLSARVLQLANSAFFAVGRPTQDVTTALPYLGTEIVRGLALAVHLYARTRAHVSRRALEEVERRSLVRDGGATAGRRRWPTPRSPPA